MIARAKHVKNKLFSQKLLIFGKGMKAGFVVCLLHRNTVCCPEQNNYILKFQINDKSFNSM